MSSNVANAEELRGVSAGEAGGPVEMRGVGAAAGEWPAQQPELMPVVESRIAMALGRVPGIDDDLERIVLGLRFMAIDEEALYERMNAETIAFIEGILRARREGNEPAVVVAEQPRFINSLPWTIRQIDDDQELADLVDSSVSTIGSSDDDDDVEIRERMVDIGPHDATMRLEDHFPLAPPQALMMQGGHQWDADSSNEGDVSGDSSNRSGSLNLSTLNNAFVQPENIVHGEDDSEGPSARILRNVETQAVSRRRGVKRQYVESEDDARAPDAKRRRAESMNVEDMEEAEDAPMDESVVDIDSQPMDVDPANGVLENGLTDEGIAGEPNDEEEELMEVAVPQQPHPDFDDEFPEIAGIDFHMPEDHPNADDEADQQDEGEIEDMEDDDSEDEEPDDGSDEDEEEAAEHNVDLEDRNMADVWRQQLPTLLSQQDVDGCIDQKLTRNAMLGALMEEVSKANAVEDGVALMHPSVYVDACAGHLMAQNIVHDHMFFRKASWIIVPMLNNAGTQSEHWSIGCLNMEQRDLIIYDSKVPSKSVKDERIGVMRSIMAACIDANEADLLKYRYSYRNRCNQERFDEENDDGIYCIYHARRWLQGDIVVINKGAADDCEVGAERQRLRGVLEALRNELNGYMFRPIATPPPVFHLPPPPQPQGPYHVVRRDNRATQDRIRNCYMRLNARS